MLTTLLSSTPRPSRIKLKTKDWKTHDIEKLVKLPPLAVAAFGTFCLGPIY